MIDCYSVTLSRDTSEDKTNNAFTLFGLIERLGISELGAGVPFHVLTQWYNSGSDPVKVKMRVRFRILGVEDAESFTPDHEWEMPPGISRGRLVGFNTPKAEGVCRISVMLQIDGTEQWHESAASWYFHLEHIE